MRALSPNFFNTIHATLLAQPDRVLVVWPAAGAAAPATYSGRELATLVDGHRATLAGGGVRAGEPVLLLLPVGIELIGTLLAVMAVGAVPVLPPAGASALSLLRLARRGGIRRAVVGAGPPAWVRLVAAGLGLRLLRATPPAAAVVAGAAPAVGAGQAALISHSSGSTGPAKPVRRSHQVLQAQHEVLKAVFPPLPGQRDCPLFPNVLLHNLAAGVCTVLPDVPWTDLARLDAARVVGQLGREQVQTLTGNVFYFTRLAAHLTQFPTALPQVTALGIGGSPVPEGLVRRLAALLPRARCYVIYGSSEAEPIAVRQLAAEAEPLPPRAGYCVGPVLPSLTWRLRLIGRVWVGPGQELVPVGEVQVRGPHVAAEGWLSTGDFGYLGPGQQLCLTGRAGNEAICRQLQHYQPEHVLQHLPGVARVAARPGPQGFVVYVERLPGARLTAADVRQALAAAFPAPAFPQSVAARVLFRRRLPVDRRHLSKIRYGALQ